jgi:hypothetical protein
MATTKGLFLNNAMSLKEALEADGDADAEVITSALVSNPFYRATQTDSSRSKSMYGLCTNVYASYVLHMHSAIQFKDMSASYQSQSQRQAKVRGSPGTSL